MTTENAAQAMDPTKPTPARSIVEGYVTSRKYTQSEIAKRVGVSTAALSAWLKGTYQGNNENMAKKAQRWIDSMKLQEKVATCAHEPPAWVDLPVAKKIHDTMAFAQMLSDFAVIYGPPGIGKTHAMKRYAAFHPNVWIVTIRPSLRAVAGVTDKIAQIMQIKGRWKSRNSTDQIVNKLEGTGGLLIVDEAQHLSIEAIEEIRYIHDASETGLILAGNYYVYSRITGNGQRDESFAQIFSRVGKRLKLSRPSTKDIRKYAEALGITDEKQVKFVVSVAQKPSGLRGVVKMWRLATMYATAEESGLSLHHLKAAQKELTRDENKETSHAVT